MADDTQQGGTADKIATDDLTTYNGATVALGTAKAQRVKVGYGADGTFRDVENGYPLPVMLVPAATGTITSPALAVASFTALAANTARKMATFYNDSTNTVYLALAAAASTTSYTVQIPPGGYYELPGDITVYTGAVTAISAVASGNLRVTELT